MSGFPEAASGKMASGKVSPTHTPALWEPGHRAGSAGVLGSRIWGEVRRTGCGQAGKTSALLCQGLLGEPGSGGSAAGAGGGASAEREHLPDGAAHRMLSGGQEPGRPLGRK